MNNRINAVIMAAGMSTRFAPLSYEKPKGLWKVKGEILIEREIRQLKEAGITDITVVVGYKKEQFFYLEEKFGVEIVVNEDYYRYNNSSTLMCVLDKLSDTYICSSDNYFMDNVFLGEPSHAYYAAVYAAGETEEYCLSTDAGGRITGVEIGGGDSWYMIGHVFFDSNFSKRFKEILRKEYDKPEVREQLWENLYMKHLDELDMRIRKYEADRVLEFDTLDEICRFDPKFIDSIDPKLLDKIRLDLNCGTEDCGSNDGKYVTDARETKDQNGNGIDWMITLTPFILIMALAALLFIFPEGANAVIGRVRFFFGDTLGSYYLIIGLGVLVVAILLSFSKYGNIILGNPDEKPRYSFFVWGSMMFTCGLAADILFYSFAEWVMYAANPHIAELGLISEWAGVFPLFHWSFIPWAFYLVLAVAFGFMLHVRRRGRQRYSEACRPVIGDKADKLTGRVIDLFALFALLAGTATTFSVATPLMAEIIAELIGITLSRTAVTIIILLITCVIYTYAVLHGFRGISILAKVCIYLFFGLLAVVFFAGGQERFIIENGFQSLGKMLQNFIELSTYTDPGRTNHFSQDWTIYYWAYWMVWCIAAPFFIGNISRGRTVRQTILGGFIFGVGSTIISFVILGNYGLGLQVSGKADFIAKYEEGGDLYELILNIIENMPASAVILALTFLCMVAFYATSFDSIAYTASCYSYRRLGEDEQPHRMVELLWCVLLIILPVAFVYSESSMNNIQSVSIISAFPIGIIMVVMVWSFIKDAGKYLKEQENK